MLWNRSDCDTSLELEYYETKKKGGHGDTKEYEQQIDVKGKK